MRRIQDAKILIVDDSHELLDLLRDALGGAGYCHPRIADSVSSARALLAQEKPELIILDINLPDGDGFSLYREIRGKSDGPILFLSARDADSDRLFGLGLGADDYLTKPFLMQELLLRVQLILRRYYRNELQREETLTLGDCQINLDDATVERNGTAVTLTATERTILQKLTENRGHIVTFDAICEAVWSDSYYGYENSLGVHIRHLREKIEETPSKPKWLLTARGLGYQLKREDAP